jgi:hypothetical protein
MFLETVGTLFVGKRQKTIRLPLDLDISDHFWDTTTCIVEHATHTIIAVCSEHGTNCVFFQSNEKFGLSRIFNALQNTAWIHIVI